MKLTPRRFEKAEPIFERYRDKLAKSKLHCVWLIEDELKECLNAGYQELKGLFCDLCKRDRFKYLAAFYMENAHGGIGVVSEFKRPLAKLYGASSYDYDPEIDTKRKVFWEQMPSLN